MKNEVEVHRPKPKTALSWVMVFALLFSMINAALAAPAAADSVRSAVIVEVNGDVTYTKSGGYRSTWAYTDLTLNQGDSITTGYDSSVVLRVVDRGDELTIGENSEVYISELLDDGGSKSTFSAWAGSVWSKVKSLVSSEDEFEVETPTAVMGVRGTHFLTYINPITGQTTMLVASGRVKTTALNNETSEQPNGNNDTQSQNPRTAIVYPSQQINLDTSNQTPDLRTRVDYANTKDLVNKTSPRVLEQFLKDVPDIQRENEQLKQKLQEQFNRGQAKPEPESILYFTNEDELSKTKQNFDALLPRLAKEAVDQKKIDQKIIDELNKKIADPNKKMDLNNIPPLDPKAALDPEIEKLKQQQTTSDRAAQEQRQMLENQQRLQELLKKLEEDKARIEEENLKAAKEAAEKAEALLKQQLTAEEAAKYDQAKQNGNSQSEDPSPSPTQGGGSAGGGGTGSGSTPVISAPTWVSGPSKVTKNANATFTFNAAPGAYVYLYNGSTQLSEYGYADASGLATVTLTSLSLPSVGTYNLSAAASVNGVMSSQITVPAIQVLEPSVTLKQIGTVSGGKATIQLDMKDFLNDVPAFYAAQAHMVFDKTKLGYSATTVELTDAHGDVFTGTQAAATLKKVEDTSNIELIYAASFFDTATSAAPEKRLDGVQTRLLTFEVDVPTTTTAASGAEIMLAYVKFVDKSGNVIYELPLTTTNQRLPLSF